MLRIKDWEQHFETAETKRVKRLSWVAVPTKHDGKNYRRLVRTDAGVAFFGIWVILVQVAAKSPVRGCLADEDGPLSDEDLEIKTGAPASLIAQAIEHLTNVVGWTEFVDVESMAELEPHKPPGRDRGIPSERPPTGQERTDRTGQNPTGSDPGSGDRDGHSEGRQSVQTTERPARKINKNSVFLKCFDETVRDPGLLRTWFLWQSGRESRVTDSDPENWRFCLGCAEVSKSKQYPSRYFATIFGGKKHGDLSDIHKHRAIELAREFPVSNGAAHA